jgi:putative ABC transport system permease protein
MLNDVLSRVRAVFRRGAMERELDEELAFHLEMQTRQLVERGWTGEAAAEEARRRFGLVSRETQRARDSWGVTGLVDAAGDLRVAFRQLWRRPVYTLLGVGTLALGLGATVALSSVVVGLLVRSLPVADEARLQVFWSDFNWTGAEFDFVKERQRAFGGLAAFSTEGYTLRLGDQSTTVLAAVGSAELFDVLGARPLLGRAFQPGDDRPGAAPIAVVSHAFWQQELGGDAAVLGRRLEIDGSPVEIVGVMPRGFYFPSPELRIWRPLMLDPATDRYQGNGWLVLIGRERPGLTAGERDADLRAIARALGERFTYPEAWDKTRQPSVRPLRDYTMGSVRPAVLLLQAAVLLVLAIACANVAALVLARTTDRADELALRAALGAGRGRLVRQILTESVAMAALAGGLGAAIAVVGFGALVRRLPLANGMDEALAVDWTLLAVAVALAIVAGVAVALAPMRAVLAGAVRAPGKERSAGGTSGTGARRTHAVLVAVEVALAMLLVAGASMFTRSVQRLYAIDPGFDPTDVAAVDLVAPTQVMAAAERHAFFARFLPRLAAVPGVQAAGVIARLPLRDNGWQATVTIEDRADLAGDREPNAYFRIVSPGYFTAMDVAVIRGRGFTDLDGAGAPPVGIVSAAFAERMWPGRDPVGRRIRHRFGTGPQWVTVVGVAEETRIVRLTGENPNVLYVPLAQSTAPEGPSLVVKGAGGPPPLAVVRALVAEVDPRIAIGRVTTLDAVVAGAVAEPLRLRFFLGLLGGLALVVGAVGIYSVVSYSVTRRRAEFGVRLALGAAPRRILSEVVRGGLAPVAAGVAAGMAAALGLASTVRGFLYGIEGVDLISLAMAAATLFAAGLLAALIPAWRAGRTDPVSALRAE